MLSKACKSVFVIVCLFFLVSLDVGATIGAIDINMGRYAQNDEGMISVNLVEKNNNQIIIATLLDDLGNVVNVVKLNSSFSTNTSWKVKSGTYKVLLLNVKTGEREILQ